MKKAAKTFKDIQKVMKLLGDKNVRTFATVFKVTGGKIMYTDGFMLFTTTIGAAQFTDGVYNINTCAPSQFVYPDTDGVIKGFYEGAACVTDTRLFDVARQIKPANSRTVAISTTGVIDNKDPLFLLNLKYVKIAMDFGCSELFATLDGGYRFENSKGDFTVYAVGIKNSN